MHQEARAPTDDAEQVAPDVQTNSLLTWKGCKLQRRGKNQRQEKQERRLGPMCRTWTVSHRGWLTQPRGRARTHATGMFFHDWWWRNELMKVSFEARGR